MPNVTASPMTEIPAPGPERLWGTVVGDDTAFLLARANALSLSAANAGLAPLGLKVRSYSLLAVAVGDVRPTQRELSDFLRLDPSQIVALIDELERAGLVKREPDRSDRRVNVVVPTPAGRRVYEQASAAAARAEAECFAGLDDDQRAQLKQMLRTLSTPPSTPPSDA